MLPAQCCVKLMPFLCFVNDLFVLCQSVILLNYFLLCTCLFTCVARDGIVAYLRF